MSGQVSWRGNPGIPGPRGIPGPIGPQGIQGPDGPQGLPAPSNRSVLVLLVLILAGVIALLCLTMPAHAQETNFGPGSTIDSFTVASLPVGDPAGELAIVTNGNGYSCTVGGGATLVLCYYTGVVWSPVGSAGGGMGCVSPGTANRLLIDDGAGGCSDLASAGTTTIVLHGNAAGAPTYSAVVSADLNITTTTCSNQVVTAIAATGTGTCSAVVLASAQFANQGTTTTVLHGNGAGNPSFGSVVSNDLNVTTTTCVNQVVTAISAGAVGTCAAVSNAMLANQSTTVNSNTCTLGGSCTVGLGQIGNPAATTTFSYAANQGATINMTGSALNSWNTDNARAQFMNAKNTTAAVVGTSQGTPAFALCGRAFHGGADVEDCMFFSALPGNGNDAAITFNYGHTGTSTGAVTHTFAGSLSSSALSGGGTKCVHVDNNGLMTAASADCGSGAAVNPANSNITPVTVNTSTTGDQQVQELSLTAGYLNTATQPFLFHGSGIFSTTLVPTITIKFKLCSVSGCGSGTVITLATMTSASTTSATNNQLLADLTCATHVTGATGDLICHGRLALDLTASNVLATTYSDANTAVSTAFDLTAAWFVDTSIAFSSASASNSFTEQQMWLAPLATPTATSIACSGVTNGVCNNATNTGTAAMTLNMAASTTANSFRAPVGAGLTAGADGVVAYDSTNKNTHIRTNGADSIACGFASAPTTLDLVRVTVAASVVVCDDAGFLASNVVRKDTTNTGAAAMTLDMSASTTANSLKVPVGAGLTSGADGAVAYDSTAKITHVRTNGADSTAVTATATSTTTTQVLHATAVAGIGSFSALVDADIPAAITRTIANGTSALGTGAITSGACATVVTTSATNTATTDNIIADFNADPTGVTGYAASANGMLTIIKYPTANNVNFKVCNNTASSITPGAITLNWRVVR